MVAAISQPAPRINSTLLQQRVGLQVTVVGKVKPGVGQGEYVHLEGSDGGDIIVNRSQSVQGDYGSDFVEVVGTVNADRTVTEAKFSNFGNDFDLKQYNDLVLLSNGALKHLFQ
eukprot:CAMPEP_0173436732 /NCGR_PEP_ID=MMETSP1357-20121228/17030_1 /TAXON_ID=77926 /ORGANISM="Hemiselmis rufescens, Strain PCC563" /LENGTH=113 /DNA_ID=CAMNT_0014401855 /DNA_START=56 /DNA_END=397 /DNA_ORIENTATION=+